MDPRLDGSGARTPDRRRPGRGQADARDHPPEETVRRDRRAHPRRDRPGAQASVGRRTGASRACPGGLRGGGRSHRAGRRGAGRPRLGIPVRARHLLALSGLLLGAVLGMPARAQEAPTTAAQELAKNARNPFAEFVKLPVQFTTGFGVGPHHRAGESINVQPELPLSLSAEWDLIFRPSVTATYLPGPGAQFGLEDLQASLFLTPAGATKWIWGLGPIVQLPTATTDELGTGRWSAGPTGALIYSSGLTTASSCGRRSPTDDRAVARAGRDCQTKVARR